MPVAMPAVPNLEHAPMTVNKIGVDFQRAAKVVSCSRQSFFIIDVALKYIHPAQVFLIGFCVSLRDGTAISLGRPQQSNLKGTGYAICYFRLDGKDVVQLPVEGLGPEVIAVGSVLIS